MVSCWAEFYDKIYQPDDNKIPNSNSMNIGKLSHGGGINSCNCNAARKKLMLLVDAVKQADF